MQREKQSSLKLTNEKFFSPINKRTMGQTSFLFLLFGAKVQRVALRLTPLQCCLAFNRNPASVPVL